MTTKPEAATLTDTLADFLADRIYDTGATFCADDGETSQDVIQYPVRDLSERLAVEVSRWLRTALLGDEVVEAAARAVAGVIEAENPAAYRPFDFMYDHIAEDALTAALDRVEALNTEEAGS